MCFNAFYVNTCMESSNRLQSEPLSTFGYPAGEMMNNILLQSISSTLENIQMWLKAIEDKHQQTDDAVADLKISLQDIKSNEKKQASYSKTIYYFIKYL